MPLEQTSFVTPLGLTLLLVTCVLMLVLPRRWALIPIFVLTCFMTGGQLIMVANLNFTLLRLVILFGALRILVRQEFRGLRLNVIDKTLIWYVFFSIVTYTALRLTAEALIYKLGGAYNVIGLYFIFRCFVRDLDEAKQAVRLLAVMVIPLAGAMFFERMTQRNPFATFGGVAPITGIRDGVLRCQGPFGHAILAGSFGATLLPLFFALWWHGKDKLRGLMGMVSSLVITLVAGSSTPVLSAAVGVGALAFWPLRRQMRTLRWTLLFTLIMLHLVMKAPVWFIIAHLSVFSASTAFYRAELIDMAIRNLDEWWFIGMLSTDHWGEGFFDVTNQFVRIGVDGGLISMLLYIFVIIHCFRGVGFAMKSTGYRTGSDQKFLWALGSALFAHIITFLGVSYFDQNIVTFYLLLAMISMASGPYLLSRKAANGFALPLAVTAGAQSKSPR